MTDSTHDDASASEPPVVPAAERARRMPGQVCEKVPDLAGAVVVASDGSGSSHAALAFGATEARLRGVPLVVLRAWSILHAPRPAGVEPGVVPPMTEFERAVADELRTEVRRVLGPDAPSVQVLPVHAKAIDAVVAATATATLVVMGHAHRGRIGQLLGSVSDHVLRHARGPVAVVP